MLNNKKVLVTGGAGFIGSNLCEYLLKNNEVVCLDNFLTGHRSNVEHHLSNPKFTLIEGDIRNMKDCEKACSGVDVVLHQAALGSVPRSIEDPHTTNDINVGGFLNMISAAKEAGVKRFVYATSSSVYGDSKELPKVEENTGNPLSPYAVSKCVNELYARVYSDLHDMNVVGLRYFNVFGRQQDPEGVYAAAIPKFIMMLMKGEAPTIHGDGSQSRDFTYIDNVIHANELAASSDNPGIKGEVFNVAYGGAVTVTDLVVKLRDLLAKFDSKIGNIEPIYIESRKGDVKHSNASIDKARSLLGYDPQYSVNAGLEKAIDWYWENLN